jgi:hypothetical protein
MQEGNHYSIRGVGRKVGTSSFFETIGATAPYKQDKVGTLKIERFPSKHFLMNIRFKVQILTTCI